MSFSFHFASIDLERKRFRFCGISGIRCLILADEVQKNNQSALHTLSASFGCCFFGRFITHQSRICAYILCHSDSFPRVGVEMSHKTPDCRKCSLRLDNQVVPVHARVFRIHFVITRPTCILQDFVDLVDLLKEHQTCVRGHAGSMGGERSTFGYSRSVDDLAG